MPRARLTAEAIADWATPAKAHHLKQPCCMRLRHQEDSKTEQGHTKVNATTWAPIPKVLKSKPPSSPGLCSQYFQQLLLRVQGHPLPQGEGHHGGPESS